MHKAYAYLKGFLIDFLGYGFGNGNEDGNSYDLICYDTGDGVDEGYGDCGDGFGDGRSDCFGDGYSGGFGTQEDEDTTVIFLETDD